MLSYNSENLIEATLRSVLPYVNECHIIDTGSKDKTVEVIKSLWKDFPFIDLEVIDIDSLGKAWVDKLKNVALTELLEKLRLKTKSDWILKVDDDEVYPEDTMKEIINLEPKRDLYALYFRHFQKDFGTIINYRRHKNLRVLRLWKNIPEITWTGIYGYECLSINGKRYNTKRFPYIAEPFLHFGEYRKGLWEHAYRFHTPGHCGLRVPPKYVKYIPK